MSAAAPQKVEDLFKAHTKGSAGSSPSPEANKKMSPSKKARTPSKGKSGGQSSLAELFKKGEDTISHVKKNNVFKDLEGRSLTTEEEDIIAKRVAHQRAMLEEYEKREQKRKINEIREMVPDCSEEEAEMALTHHDGREDDACAALTGDPSFRAQLRRWLGPAAAPRAAAPTGGAYNEKGNLKPWRPATTSVTALGGPSSRLEEHGVDGSVFVGSFNGKLASVRTGSMPVRNAKGGRPKRPAPAAPSAPSAPSTTTAKPPTPTPASDPKPNAATDSGAGNAAAPSSSPAKGVLRPGEQPVPLEDLAAMSKLRPKALAAELEGRRFRTKEGVYPEGIFYGIVAGVDPTHKTARLEYEPTKEGEEGDVDADCPIVELLCGKEFEILHVPSDEGEEEETNPASATTAPKVTEGAAARRARGRAGAKRAEGEAAKKAEGVDDADADNEGEQEEEATPASPTPAPPPMATRSTPKRKAAATPAKSPAPKPAAADETTTPKRPRRAAVDRAVAMAAAEAIEAEAEAEGKVKDKSKTPTKSPRQKENDTAAPNVNEAGTSGGGAGPSGGGASSSAPPRGVPPGKAMKKPSMGRVKKGSVKRAELLELGTVRFDEGWFNKGYIFTDGYKARTHFRSSVQLDALCAHICEIYLDPSAPPVKAKGKGGKLARGPTFKVTAMDRPNEPLIGASATSCWTQVLKRINAEIERRIADGEDLPPPPKTAIAGPEYFGLNMGEVIEGIEAQDPDRLCKPYWSGRMEREEYLQCNPLPAAAAPKAPKAPRPVGGGGGGGGGGGSSRKRKGRAGRGGSDTETDDEGGGDKDAEAAAASNRWSSINRGERRRQRAMAAGEDGEAEGVEAAANNPLPKMIDPITLDPVVNPAISPFGHVMGYATWLAVLSEQGKCPFTKQDLRKDQIKQLTLTNIELYRDKIVNMD